MEEFYWSLGMRAEFVEVNSGNLARIAQLTQKTNQLNLTTRRYTESQIVDMCQDPAWRISGVRLIDNFGDNGIVGTIFMKIAAETAEIDTLLLSCRVIGRTVETAILARACDTAAMSGCKRLTGWFLPSNKNAPAADIYSEHVFIMTAQEGEGTFWELDLSNKSISMPAWISPSSGRIDV